jgi:arylsulfatase A-like enzyme
MMLRIFCVLLLLVVGPTTAAAAPPNIIMVFVDDLGWGDLSCFGNMEAETPNIDRLAAEGIRFTQFYVNSPICSPSRCALTTGAYPQRWRITSFLNNRADNERRGVANWLDPAAPTLPRILQGHGYATGHFGKWHLGGQRDVADAPPITAYGFDETLTNFEGLGAKLLPLTLKPGETEPGRIWADAERLGGPVVWMQRSEITGGFAGAAASFIGRAVADGKPFYVNIWPDDVHGPWWPPTSQWGDGGRRSLYLAVLEAMDRQLGRLFELVRSSPALRDNTLILLCSDNGHEPGAGSAGPLRGHKAVLYEGGVRSPMIAWGPGLIDRAKTGSTNDETVLSVMDLVPSLLAVAGMGPDASTKFDGENLSAVLVGKENASRRAPLFWRRPPDRKSAYGAGPLPDLAVRDGEWKLLCEFDGTKPELYHMTTDRGEITNLAAQHPEVVARLTQAVLAWNESMPQDEGRALGSTNSAPKQRRPNRKTDRP